MTKLERHGGRPPKVSGPRSRSPLPTGVVAYRVPANLCPLVTFSLEEVAPVWFASSIDDGRRILSEHVGLAVLATIPAAEAQAQLEDLSGLCQEFPHAGWVGLFVDGVSDLGALAHLGALGVHKIVPATRLHTSSVLRDALSRGEAASVAARLRHVTHLDVHEPAATLLWRALSIAHAPISMAAFAAAARMHERTIPKTL